ncbi:DUF6249 domain-containing protein [Phenylobacterium montanum]|uniref:DUF6249 domain-containing protein n=1 Tax=Phenylobacterium montanum TaxID=2823693 RepID=A0A975G0U0_9CAUL|nr:DUF6249 domain-containing protein [Caulobacter sp. S6]QUD88825.1 hypothetical protein KCG34_02745 [Caulobacter sp. S6]
MGELANVLVPLAGVAMIVAVIVGPIWIISYFKSRERQRLHDTLRLMVEKGQPVSSELLDTLNTGRPRTPPNDMRRGVWLVAIALALGAAGLIGGLTGDGDMVGFLCGLAAFPGFIGLGYVVMAILNRDKPKA